MKMKLNKYKVSGVVLIMSLILEVTGCVDPIAFDASDEFPRLVVFGSFTQQSIDHEIEIRRTSSFGNIGSVVSGAIVEIIDEEGKRAQYVENYEGKYILAEGDMCGEPGKAYKLSISFGNQRRFESSWEVMPEPIGIEDTKLEVNYRKQLNNANVLIEQFFIDIMIDAPVKTSEGRSAYFRWQTDEVWALIDFSCGWSDPSEICFYEVPSKFSNLNIYKSLDDSQEMLENYLVHYRIATPFIEFTEKHYFNVNQYSISESAYDYWEKINIVTNPTGSIFDKLPAAVPGNIEEVNGDLEVLGYFEVASVSNGRIYIDYSGLNRYIQFQRACNNLYPPFWQPDYCCFCSVLPNQVPKPAWWGE